MKTPSKPSILSPGKGSPMFQTKKRGSGFENSGSNPEPSSPKVTCIGQVRVKTKKQGEKMRHLSRRRSGDMSFRKIEVQRQSSVNSIHHQQECSSHRNQRWVHLPLTICETLRGFGSEFSCLFPCKSSCFSGERDGRDHGRERRDHLVKWLNDEDHDYEDEKVIRRHVFDEIEIKDFNEGGRVSLCVPPKNALLLMRCRSDPVKMEALASKVWEPKLQIDEDEDEESGDFNDENDDGQYRNQDFKTVGAKTNYCEFLDGNGKEEQVVSFDKVKVVEVFEERRASISYNIINEVEENEEDAKMEIEVQGNDKEKFVEALHVNEEMHEKSEQEEDSHEVQNGEEKEESSFASTLEALVSEERDVLVHLDGQKEQEKQDVEDALVFDQNDSILQKVQEESGKDGALEGKANGEVLEREPGRKIKKGERETTQGLPECLLLMMCEPKLSMEVSKETWVCSTDFIRKKKKPHAPHAPPPLKKSTPEYEDPVIKKRNSVDSKCNHNPFAALPPPYPAAQNIQPGRASCCLPAARGGASMASMIEQKLGDAVAYEPFVLTRCKSEPMRTASKLAQEACFWKNKAGC
ncbi:uncharacterized protein LOC141684312 [Apium graveolens]|uniref:uncharacterized protein LOC141684312 n=1 Tax=Apium graveolens TaxID=4045 RepID=UPI003D79AC47